MAKGSDPLNKGITMPKIIKAVTFPETYKRLKEVTNLVELYSWLGGQVYDPPAEQKKFVKLKITIEKVK